MLYTYYTRVRACIYIYVYTRSQRKFLKCKTTQQRIITRVPGKPVGGRGGGERGVQGIRGVAALAAVCFKIKGPDFLWSLVYSVEATARKNQ